MILTINVINVYIHYIIITNIMKIYIGKVLFHIFLIFNIINE